jgi:uncharacterized membrane protein
MLLVLGVLLWSATHLFTRLGSHSREALIRRLGLGPYKGMYSLLLVLAIVLMVLGWKAMPPTALWTPPAGLRHLTLALMPLAIILFTAARAPTDLRRVMRHPQLTGVKLWALLHLLSNGELRSILLFGGLLAWAVIEVIVINRRSGPWVRPAPVGAAKTAFSTVVALLITLLLAAGHPWFAGMPVISIGEVPSVLE